jgi:hypothetical protein
VPLFFSSVDLWGNRALFSVADRHHGDLEMYETRAVQMQTAKRATHDAAVSALAAAATATAAVAAAAAAAQQSRADEATQTVEVVFDVASTPAAATPLPVAALPAEDLREAADAEPQTQTQMQPSPEEKMHEPNIADVRRAVQDLLDELLAEASAMAPKPSPAAPPAAAPQPPQLSQALEPHEQPHKSDGVSTVAPPLPLPPPTTLLPPLPLPPTLKGEQGAAPADDEGGRHRVSDEDAAQQRAARLEALAAEARWLEKALRDRIQVRCAV